MKTVLIGHRGTGKTQFLQRISNYYSERSLPVQCVDIDAEIESSQGQSIESIFNSHGEEHFRRLEEECFKKHMQQSGPSTFIALGAGFQFEIPDSVHVIWVRRPTDSNGRVFLNRPLLNKGLSPLQDYFQRYEERERRYSQRADEVLMIPEGFDRPHEGELIALGLKPTQLKASLTVLPENFRTAQSFEHFVMKRKQWGLKYFELRDDLLSEEQIQAAIEVLPENQTLLSFRKNWETVFYRTGFKERIWDWALELGPCPHRTPDILSLHERKGQSVKACGEALLKQKALHYKLAVNIENFDELLEGHEWWQEDPTQRSFLPRSEYGRWAWYRLWAGQQMKINFIREGQGSALDQPLVLDFIRRLGVGNQFAAILGNPVRHSLTPSEQQSFFTERSMPVLSIPLRESEATEENLDILELIGLRAAAVTSPLKKSFFHLCSQHDQYSQALETVNTVAFDKVQGHWVAKNTDVYGLEKLVADLADRNDVAVWGGGGTRPVLERFLPEARLFSARTGSALNNESNDFQPKVVVWAVGRSRQKDCVWPPDFWQPELVVDLNYTEDSPGLEYAKQIGCDYRAGDLMFSIQANKQREFWKYYL